MNQQLKKQRDARLKAFSSMAPEDYDIERDDGNGSRKYSTAYVFINEKLADSACGYAISASNATTQFKGPQIQRSIAADIELIKLHIKSGVMLPADKERAERTIKSLLKNGRRH